LAFRFRYRFLPKAIMPRFMVRRHREIKDQLRWRTGVVLESKDCEAAAVIKADEREQTIAVTVTGTRKRDFFAVIRTTFRDIHHSFENLWVEEWIPLPDFPGEAVEYRELLGYEKAGRDEYFVGKLGKSYSVAKLLSGIKKPEDRHKGEEKIIKGEALPQVSVSITNPQTLNSTEAGEKQEKKRFPLFWKIIGGIGALIAALAALATVFDSQAAKSFWSWLSGVFK